MSRVMKSICETPLLIIGCKWSLSIFNMTCSKLALPLILHKIHPRIILRKSHHGEITDSRKKDQWKITSDYRDRLKYCITVLFQTSLNDYCKAFHWGLKLMLITLLMTLLIYWCPKISIKNSECLYQNVTGC